MRPYRWRLAAVLAISLTGTVLALFVPYLAKLLVDRGLLLASLIMLPPALWALFAYRRRLETGVAEMRDRSADIGSFLIESLLGMKVVVASNAQEREATRFRIRNDGFIDALMRMRRL